MATIGRIVVLLCVDILVIYVMYMMMAYLSDVWDIGFTNAAAILNVFWGVVAVSPLFLIYIVDTVTGNYSMLLISTVAYCIGMGLLTMSTPPVLANSMGNCKEYKQECVGHGQKVLFYTAMPLIAFGMAGHFACWNGFIADQFNDGEEETDKGTFRRMFTVLNLVTTTIVAAAALPYMGPWSLTFGIPAICTLVATLLFISGSCSYKYVGPQGSSLTTFVRVFVSSVSKLFYRTPKDAKKLYENHNSEQDLVPHTRSLRCLDKAAIIMPNKPQDEQEKNRWRLCTVTEVEETKTIIRMIPVWMTFILCGVVSAVGFTFFVEQLHNLNPKVGRLKVSTVVPTVVLGFYKLAQNAGAKLHAKLANVGSGWRKFAPAIGIMVSMIVAILCCITAASVEHRRLGVVQKHDLVDKPNDRVPMTMFWLLPQFALLGAFSGIFDSSARYFFIDQSPASTRKYLRYMITAVFGIGILDSVLSVDVVGKMNERGGRMNWFQHDLNKSRMDKYYWTLAWLMAINLAIFVVVAVLYRYKESQLEHVDEEMEFGGMDEPYQDNAKCCYC